MKYNNAVTGLDANLQVDGVALTSASNTVTGLIPGLTFQLLSPSGTKSDGSLESVQVVVGNDTASVGSAIQTFVSDYNSLIKAVNVQSGNDSSGTPEPLFGSPTLSLLQQQLAASVNEQNPNGILDAVASNLGATLSGSITIQVGTGTAQTITLDSTDNTLSGLADAINKAGIGVTAAVKTTGNVSTLALFSSTVGSAGALTVSSALTATSSTLLGYSGQGASSTANASGLLGPVGSAADTLSGSITVAVGAGAAQTVSVDPANPTLAGLADAINEANLGVTASVTANADGTSSLSLLSGTAGTTGTLSVTSSILDTAETTTASIGYSPSSDISTLANLGISTSSNYDGTLSLDTTTLISTLNSDFGGVAGFFQNASSWGQSVARTLEGAGNTAKSGLLSLQHTSNSTIESMLNANISREESLISAQQKSLTAVLNTANQMMQAIPMQLTEINMLYSAITGYKQNG